jgi:hypothetical protein
MMQIQFDPASFSIATLALAMAAIQLYCNNSRRRTGYELSVLSSRLVHFDRSLKRLGHLYSFTLLAANVEAVGGWFGV